jgi:sec-independent protein translocase protein TatA
MASRGARYADPVPFNVGGPELIIILVLALIVLGPKKLPDFGRSLGNGLREFKDSIGGGSDRRDDDDDTYALR